MCRHSKNTLRGLDVGLIKMLISVKFSGGLCAPKIKTARQIMSCKCQKFSGFILRTDWLVDIFFG
jgi:hypothetical protein